MPKIIVVPNCVIVENGLFCQNLVLLNMLYYTVNYKFCGGKIENPNESLIEAACRETKKEMGFEPKIINPEPFIFFAMKEENGQSTDIIFVDFLAGRTGKIKPEIENVLKESGRVRRKFKNIFDYGYIPTDNLPDNLEPDIIPALIHFGFLK